MRLRRLVTWFPFVVLPAFACEDGDPATAPPSGIPEAGAFDGATPALDAAPTGAVSVTVHADSGPASGRLVVFHDAAGGVLETQTTGADGKTSSSGATPAMVSVRLGKESAVRLVTWTGIEAGDALSVLDVDRYADRGSYAVSLTAPFTGATSYRAGVGTCTAPSWDGASATTLGLQASCARGQNAILVEALGPGGNILAHGFTKNVGLPSGASPTPVQVGNFVAPTNIVLRQTNAPAGTSSFVTEIVGDVGYPRGGGAVTSSVTVPVATGFADGVQATVFSESSAGGLALSRRATAPFAENTFAFDFATALPRITEPKLTKTEPLRPEVSWSAERPLTASDGGLVRIDYNISDFTVEWTLVVPPSATSVKAPALPADVLPDPATARFEPPRIFFVESELVPDYRAFRRQPGSLVEDISFGAIPPLPTNGLVKVTYSLSAAR